MFYTQVSTLHELPLAANGLLQAFPDSRIFAFYGNMGAGKTTFIQSLCRELGSNDYITSPTFALVNEYDSDRDHRIFHFDFYRIKSISEAYDMGYEDYFFSGHFCFIEWPEKIESLLPEDTVKIEITVGKDGSRLIQEKP